MTVPRTTNIPAFMPAWPYRLACASYTSGPTIFMRLDWFFHAFHNHAALDASDIFCTKFSLAPSVDYKITIVVSKLRIEQRKHKRASLVPARNWKVTTIPSRLSTDRPPSAGTPL